ncbi:hypothetical protein RchiOBHm_Chr5g0047941 [Rosa chinensis]|uniref:Uncharacterized protein n=1 Tax=Rosa chinensis TaxID=74649 RepID=A0A2P6QEH9_ROSCH|nr:hypothetical protein RchiOBHm_Chr5g0047941 [Rosa chinensis]
MELNPANFNRASNLTKVRDNIFKNTVGKNQEMKKRYLTKHTLLLEAL